MLPGPSRKEEEGEGGRGCGTGFRALVFETRRDPVQVHHYRKTLNSESITGRTKLTIN